eukprot:g25939.t1
MWELADPIVNNGDHICNKCWLLEELQLSVDELESELQILRHIWEGEKYLDAMFQEAVTPGRLSASDLVGGQGEQGMTASEAGRGILHSGTEEPQLLTLSTRVRDIYDQLERILEKEGEDPVVVVHIKTNNIGKTRKEDLFTANQELGMKLKNRSSRKEGFLFMGHWHQFWNRRDLYRWDGLRLSRAGANVLAKRQLVVKPTQEQVILDLVLCNEADLIREPKVKEALGGSDHNMIELTLKFEREKIESE